MTRTKSKLVSGILIFSILLSIFSICASSNDSSEEYKTVAHHHFHKLGSNVPANSHGSCGYVAMSMLLSFYDTYWSDLFVAEKYENPLKPSVTPANNYPNTVASLILENGDLSDDEKDNESAYRNFIYENANKYLHMNLILLGIQNNLNHEDDNEDSFGITASETAGVLDKYFDLIFGAADYYREDQNYDETLPVTVHIVKEDTSAESRQNVINCIKEQVKKGNPVIYGADKIKSQSEKATSGSKNGIEKIGHWMVAYGIDDSDDILLHLGYYTGDTYSTINTVEFNLSIEAVWVEINEDILPHSCSDNYDWASNHTSVCSCIAYKDLHPEHVHEKDNEVVSRTATTHTYRCKWGDICVEELHTYISYQDSTATSHTARCACGYSTSQPHMFEYKNVSNLYHKCVCACGYTKTSNHMTRMINNRYSECTVCGAVFDMWSDVTIKKEDELTDPESE